MKPDYVQPFVSSTVSVFSTMLGCDVVPGEVVAGNRPAPHDLSGVIGLSGSSTGVVIVHLNKQTAINATGAMLGSPPKEINGDVIDVVGELTNMIAGGAKAQLSSLFSNLALPMVLVGKDCGLEFCKKVKPICIPFTSQWGPISVEVEVQDTAM